MSGIRLDRARTALRALKCLAATSASGLSVFLVAPGEARADVSSWVYVGGGLSRVDAGGTDDYAALALDSGLGTPATAPVVVGLGFHGTGHFGYGLDLGGALRIAMSSYARGNFGVGLDLGPQYRFGDDDGTRGAARLLLGAPWGVAATVGGSYGKDEVKTFTVTLGLDFARLTVHRETGLNWFPNPERSPAGDAFH